jgi:hypothetical protein
MLPDTDIDDVKKQRNAEYAKHINDPVLSSLTMEGIRLHLVSIPITVTCLLTQYGFLILVFEGLGYVADGLGIEVRFSAKAIYFHLLLRRDRFW